MKKKREDSEDQKNYLVNYPHLQLLFWDAIYYSPGDIYKEYEEVFGTEYEMYSQTITETFIAKAFKRGNLFIKKNNKVIEKENLEFKEVDNLKYYNNKNIRKIPVFSRKKQSIYENLNDLWYSYDIKKKDLLYAYSNIKFRNILRYIFFVVSIIGIIILCVLLKKVFRVLFIQQAYYMTYILKTIKVQILFFNIEDIKNDIIVIMKEFIEYIKNKYN